MLKVGGVGTRGVLSEGRVSVKGSKNLVCSWGGYEMEPGKIMGLYRGYIGIMEKKMEATI